VKKTRIKKLLSNLKNKRIESDGVFSENKKLFFAEISIQIFFWQIRILLMILEIKFKSYMIGLEIVGQNKVIDLLMDKRKTFQWWAYYFSSLFILDVPT